jgi:putative N-acetyltransferase (TIGR04045 family)
MKKIVVKQAKSRDEIRDIFIIRKEVFVHEQKMFEGSDIDQDDSRSIYLFAKFDGEIVGTVRLFPANHGNDHWVGGRLAVKKAYRSYGIGKLLVQDAVRYVKKHNCSKFTAHIQVENVSFFSRLGWRAVGTIKPYFGTPHQLMQASLDFTDKLFATSPPSPPVEVHPHKTKSNKR